MHELRHPRSRQPRLVARRGGLAPAHQACRWRPGSTSSTRPTCTPTARARRSSAGRWTSSPTATRSSLATKVHGQMRKGPNGWGLSRKAIMTEIDHSLRRLGMDYVDLYQIHRFDKRVPIEETMEALHDVVKAGKARYIGASSMWAWQFAKAQHVAEVNGWTKFVTMQDHYNLLYREEEREMLPLCVDQGVGVIPWSPLARGTADPRLGRRHRAQRDRRVRQDPVPQRRPGDHRARRQDRRRPGRVARPGGAGLGGRASGRCRRRSSGRPRSSTSTTRSPRSSWC